jgi:hypothetical protein
MLNSTAVELLFILLLSTLSVLLHEITHILYARLMSPISIEQVSYLPFRVEISFEKTVHTTQTAIVALAPTITGLLVAALIFYSGLWSHLRSSDPYYLWFVFLLNWLLYSLPSPADIRVLTD